MAISIHRACELAPTHRTCNTYSQIKFALYHKLISQTKGLISLKKVELELEQVELVFWLHRLHLLADKMLFRLLTCYNMKPLYF